SYDIGNYDSDFLVARARPDKGGPGYRVRMVLPDTDEEYPEVVIKSIDEAIPAVAAYYEANPPQWELKPRHNQVGPYRVRYIKDTQFGILRVEQTETGQWVAYRDGHGLSVACGKIAKFATREEVNALPMCTSATAIPTPK